jgi:hypothetical protein
MRAKNIPNILIFCLSVLFICSIVILVITIKTRRVFYTFESNRIVLPKIDRNILPLISVDEDSLTKISLRSVLKKTFIILENEESYEWPKQKNDFKRKVEDKIFAAKNYSLVAVKPRFGLHSVRVWAEEKFPAQDFLDISSLLANIGFSRIDLVVDVKEKNTKEKRKDAE